MCGIFGIISRPNLFSENDIKNSLHQIVHRGPDDWGIEKYQIFENWEIWFAQRRLSILDLSKAGHQPMKHKDNKDNLESIVFNGEIYNFQELKKDLIQNWEFTSNTDTEIILAGLHLYGNDYIKKLNGMLAFAYLNQKERKILLARDRIGKKPIYIYQSQECIIFSSELKAIYSLGLNLTLNNESLSYFRWLGYIPGHLSIYNECKKINAASYIEINITKDKLNISNEVLYWDPLKSYSIKYPYSYNDAIDQFLELLDDSTKKRIVSDVPVGCFLSGGIDSSLVASSLKKLNTKNIDAFTVKFDDNDFDESNIAIETANQLNIPIKILHLKAEDYKNQINKIPFHYDEPFSDSSQIPTLAISEAAKKYVSVVLTGDGGDEVFLGYPRFSYANKIQKINKIGSKIPFYNQFILKNINTKLGRKIFKIILNNLLIKSTNIDSKISKIIDLLNAKDTKEIYDSIICTNPKSSLNNEDFLFLNSKPNYFDTVKSWYPNYSWNSLNDRSLEENFAALDMVSYMKDDVLVKVDRATMAYSLEARSPLLDYRIVEFGTSLPLNYKIKDGVHKRILRDALGRRLKGNVLKLKKMGFGVPLPKDLPAGTSLSSRWNIYIEDEWKKLFLRNGV